MWFTLLFANKSNYKFAIEMICVLFEDLDLDGAFAAFQARLRHMRNVDCLSALFRGHFSFMPQLDDLTGDILAGIEMFFTVELVPFEFCQNTQFPGDLFDIELAVI